MFNNWNNNSNNDENLTIEEILGKNNKPYCNEALGFWITYLIFLPILPIMSAAMCGICYRFGSKNKYIRRDKIYLKSMLIGAIVAFILFILWGSFGMGM